MNLCGLSLLFIFKILFNVLEFFNYYAFIVLSFDFFRIEGKISMTFGMFLIFYVILPSK